MTSRQSNALLRRWRRWSARPGGKWAFSLVLGRMARYTGSIRARILELDAGHARVEMRDRAAVRNHLRSVHAVAIANLGEVASGLAMISGIPDEARGIVTSLHVEYVKKARGTLTAESTVTPPDWRIPAEHESVAVLKDVAGDVVARVTAHWKIGPKAP